MDKKMIYVTGFIGSDRQGLARRLADEKQMPFLDLNQEIEKRDGRSVLRIAMTMGEHEVRNKEYEVLSSLGGPLVVSLSDGVILDDQCYGLLEEGMVYLADSHLSPERLWGNALALSPPPYAFLMWEDQNAAYKRFLELYETRMPIYRRLSHGV